MKTNKTRYDTETQMGKPGFLWFVCLFGVFFVTLLSLPFHFFTFSLDIQVDITPMLKMEKSTNSIIKR